MLKGRAVTLSDFLARYGDRGYILLKVILEEADSNWANPGLGDFDFKGIRDRLRSYGVEYNPSILLSKLEREYGVIETSYKSSNQHWWKITDRGSIEEVLRVKEGRPPREEEDPRIKMLKIQFYSLEPERILELVKRASRTKRMNDYMKRNLKKIVFEDLPLLVDFLEKAQSEYPEELFREIALAETILESLEKVIIKGGRRNGGMQVLEDALFSGVPEPREDSAKSGF